MASVPRPSRLTPDEYLAIERAAEFRSEFYDGEMIPVESTPMGMAGARLRHARIIANLSNALYNQLQDGDCEILTNDLRVAIGNGNFIYPDIVMVCGEARLRDNHFDTLLNPQVVIEILSPSTEARDRGRKFAECRQIATLEHYVLVGSRSPVVERFSRAADGTWPATPSPWPDGTLTLPPLPVTIPLTTIYRRVFAADHPA